MKIRKKQSVEQGVPGYGPQVAAMHTPPHAANLFRYGRGPIQNPDVRHRNKNMSHKIYWLITTALAITCVTSGHAESSPTADAIKSLVERSNRALQEENLDASINTIHSQSPSLLGVKKDLPTIFENYDLNTELVSFSFIGQDEDYAVARTKTRYIKISGPFWQNVESDSISVYRKENDEWKYWNNVKLNTRNLNEEAEQAGPECLLRGK